MAKIPEPPPVATLAAVNPDIWTLPSGTILWRVYRRGGSYPTVWDRFRDSGSLSGRFDPRPSPTSGTGCGISYCALAGLTCFAETFQSTRIIDRDADAPWLVAFRLVHSLTLLDLSGTWPTRAGASMAINTGQHPRARRWSRAIHDAYPSIEGLWYPSSMHANQPAVALYERARPALPHSPMFHRALADASLLIVLKNAAATLGYLLR